MGVVVILEDLDRMFENIRGDVKILNDMITQTEEEKKAANNSLFTLNQEIYNNIPSCMCGEIKGRYQVGEYCNNCHTRVEEPIEEHLESKIWLRAPKGVAKFLNPIVYSLVRNQFFLSNKGFNTILYLTDPYYKPKTNVDMRNPSVLINDLKEANLHNRDYNFFIENFETIINFLLDHPLFRKTKEPEIFSAFIYYLLENEREKVFCNYLPVVNKSLLVIEDKSYGKLAGQTTIMLLNAVLLLMGVDVETIQQPTLKKKCSNVAKMQDILAEYNTKVFKEVIAQKAGLIRKHITSTRSNHSCRTVITSITSSHRYNEIHFMWSASINIFKHHLFNKLLKRNWNPAQIQDFLFKYSKEYHPLIDELFKELIKESPYFGIPCLAVRNPTLTKGSIQLFFITKVKTDPLDLTTSIPISIVKNPNADFDGDLKA